MTTRDLIIRSREMWCAVTDYITCSMSVDADHFTAQEVDDIIKEHDEWLGDKKPAGLWTDGPVHWPIWRRKAQVTYPAPDADSRPLTGGFGPIDRYPNPDAAHDQRQEADYVDRKAGAP